MRSKKLKFTWDDNIILEWSKMIGDKDAEGVRLINHTGTLKLYNRGDVFHYNLKIAEIDHGVHTVYILNNPNCYKSSTTFDLVNKFKDYAINVIFY